MRIFSRVLITTLFVLVGWAFCMAQQPERIAVPLSSPGKPVNLEAHLMRGSITVKTHTGNEVIVEARVGADEEEDARRPRPGQRQNQNRDVDGKATGMKRLTNPSVGLEIEEENNKVSIESSSWGNAMNLVIQVPAATSLQLNTVQDGDITVEGVTGEIEAGTTGGEIHLRGVSGAVVANTLAGDLNVTFARIAPDKAMSFTTLDGDIDITLPADSRARLSLKSQMGEIYSDFDMTMETVNTGPQTEKPGKAGKFRVKIDKRLVGTINGGGPELQFKTFTGDIYIRKAGK